MQEDYESEEYESEEWESLRQRMSELCASNAVTSVGDEDLGP